MSVEADIREIKTKVAKLYEANKPKQTWVSASWIIGLTGWTGDKLRQAREQDIIEYRVKGTGFYQYLLESLSEKFIIKK